MSSGDVAAVQTKLAAGGARQRPAARKKPPGSLNARLSAAVSEMSAAHFEGADGGGAPPQDGGGGGSVGESAAATASLEGCLSRAEASELALRRTRAGA